MGLPLSAEASHSARVGQLLQPTVAGFTTLSPTPLLAQPAQRITYPAD